MSPPSGDATSGAVAAAIGIWEFRCEESVKDDGGRPAHNTRLFKFDGDTVTLRLLSPMVELARRLLPPDRPV